MASMSRARPATLLASVTAAAMVALMAGTTATADVPPNPDGTITYLATSTTASDPYAFRCSQPGIPQNIGYCLVTSSDLTSGPIRSGGAKNYYPMNTTKIIYSDDGVRWGSYRTALTESKLGLPNGSDGNPTNHLWAPAVRYKKSGAVPNMKAEYWLYTPDLTNADDALSSRIFVTYSTDVNTQFGNTNIPGTTVKATQVTGAPSGVYMSDPEVFTDSTVVADPDQTKDYLIWANGDNSTCGDISIRKMTSPTAIQSYGSSNAEQDAVRIQITGIPTAWGKCKATAGRYKDTTVNWPYIEGASMFRTSQWSYQPGYGSLPGPYVLIAAIKPNAVPNECSTANGQPGTSNEVIAYATGSSPTGPFAYQGIIMCGSSTEWTNQATVEQVQSTNGKSRLVMIFHDGPAPDSVGARQRRLHSEPLYSYGGKFVMITRSADQAISSSGTRNWALQKDKIVRIGARKAYADRYLAVQSDGSMLATDVTATANSMYSWETLSTGTYGDGFQARANGKWVQLRRNTDNRWWARGASWGDWEQFDTQPVGGNSRVVQMQDNSGQWVVNDASLGYMYGSTSKPGDLSAPKVDVLAK